MRIIKQEIGVSGLIVLAVAFLMYAKDFIEAGMIWEGIGCGVVGFGILIATAVLFMSGVIQKIGKK